MAEPAYAGAADSRLPETRKPDPRASGWAAAREAMIAAAESNKLAVRELAIRPYDAAALEMARLTLAVLERLGETLRQLSFDEAVFAETHAAGFREGVEWCKAQRCRVHVVDGTQAGPH
jgi:hypothetical protein